MFRSSGLFHGFPCPFFHNGSCDRPFCQFKHVKREAAGSRDLGCDYSATYSTSALPIPPTQQFNLVSTEPEPIIASVSSDVVQEEEECYSASFGLSATSNICEENETCAVGSLAVRRDSRQHSSDGSSLSNGSPQIQLETIKDTPVLPDDSAVTYDSLKKQLPDFCDRRDNNCDSDVASGDSHVVPTSASSSVSTDQTAIPGIGEIAQSLQAVNDAIQQLQKAMVKVASSGLSASALQSNVAQLDMVKKIAASIENGANKLVEQSWIIDPPRSKSHSNSSKSGNNSGAWRKIAASQPQSSDKDSLSVVKKNSHKTSSVSSGLQYKPTPINELKKIKEKEVGSLAQKVQQSSSIGEDGSVDDGTYVLPARTVKQQFDNNNKSSLVAAEKAQSIKQSTDSVKHKPNSLVSPSAVSAHQSKSKPAEVKIPHKQPPQQSLVMIDMFGMDSDDENSSANAIDLTPTEPPVKKKPKKDADAAVSIITSSRPVPVKQNKAVASSVAERQKRVVDIPTHSRTEQSSQNVQHVSAEAHDEAAFSDDSGPSISDDFDLHNSEPSTSVADPLPATSSFKQRTAHATASSDVVSARRLVVAQKKPLPTPEQVMQQRFAKLREEASRRTIAQNSEESDSTVAGKSSQQLKRHCIAREPWEDHDSTKTSSAVNASSIPKGAKRVARVPSAEVASTLARPIITAEFGNKIPVNIRQRYLDLIINECLRFSGSEQEAYDRALSEEKQLYDKATSKASYLNSVVMSIKKLRDDQGLGSPFLDMAETDVAKQIIAHRKGKVTVSHGDILAGRISRNQTFTVKRSKNVYSANQEAGSFYEQLKSYLMSPEDLDNHGFPRADPDNPGRAVLLSSELKKRIVSDNTKNLNCTRCGKQYRVDEYGIHLVTEDCIHHWGRPFKRKVAGAIESRYTCCQTVLGSEGCCVAKYHVTESIFSSSLDGFLKTEPSDEYIPDGNYGVYSLDCEMVYTTRGSELGKLTVVDQNMKVIYETLVRPYNVVLDCNTRFSGIKDADLESISTRLEDVQARLLELFNSDSILVGHSLEGDLRALKLVHHTVCDTSVVFPHRLGLPAKRALRNLMAEYLKKIIQDDVGGHDSCEDASACMELMKWKIKEDSKRRSS